jgi:hypothetical protein
VNSPPTFKNCIQLAACAANQILPMNPDLPADIFTSCLTTPIKIALRWWVTLSYKLSVWNWVLIIKTYFYFQWKYSVLFTSLCEPLFSLYFFLWILLFCLFFYSCYRNYSVLGLTADWTLMVWSTTEGFFSRLWGPPILLYNGYRGPFPRGKAWPGCDADHSPPSSAEVKNE